MIENIVHASVLGPIVLLLLFIRHIVYPALFSPLAKIPNAHPLAAITPAWITWIRYNNIENRTVFEAHKRHGEVVRLGPSELSVNCVDDGIKTIYGRGFEKVPFYSFFANYGILNMFSTLESRPHAIKKKRISNIYSKSFLMSSLDVQAISSHMIHQRLLPLLTERASGRQPMEVFALFQAAAMDMATAYFFGLTAGTNFLENDDQRQHWLEQYLRSRPREYMFYLQHFPRVTCWLAKFGIHVVPKDRVSINDEVDAWCLNMCAGAESVLSEIAAGEEPGPGKFPVVYNQLKTITKKEEISEKPSIHLDDSAARQRDTEAGEVLDIPRSPQQLEIASELMDQLIATHETFGITLLYVSWELSKNPAVQDRLRRELNDLPIPFAHDPADGAVPDAKTIDELPFLHAVLMETLRLHPAVPGGQPRITPPGSATKIGDYMVPANTLVGSYAWSLHRNPEVFPDPEGWHPERWLDDDPASAAYHGSDKKDRWFWAFSSGSRMCIGSNFAMQMMKFILAAVYTNFSTTIVDDDGIEQMDGFIAGPESDKLVLAFHQVVKAEA